MNRNDTINGTTHTTRPECSTGGRQVTISDKWTETFARIESATINGKKYEGEYVTIMAPYADGPQFAPYVSSRGYHEFTESAANKVARWATHPDRFQPITRAEGIEYVRQEIERLAEYDRAEAERVRESRARSLDQIERRWSNTME